MFLPQVWFFSIGSVFLVSLISLAGVLSLAVSKKILEKMLLFSVSFAAGGLLGDSFIHLLPEVSREGFSVFSSSGVLVGILTFFILEKFIAWRHCHLMDSEDHPHPVVFMNLIGDILHNFIDGVIIAASFLVSIPLGATTALAVVFHEIPQEIGDFSIMLHGGFSRLKAILFNFLSSLSAFLGVGLVLIFGSQIIGLTSFLVPFTAGGFIYIAGSDLIPELHKETKPSKSLLQLSGIVLGILVMLLLKIVAE